MWKPYNPNPTWKNVGDCTVRALSKALDKDWYEVYFGICVEGAVRGDMPSGNATWGAYLKDQGFRRHLPDEDVTVFQFADQHPVGVYVLALSGHVVCVKNGDVYDSWDSGNEVVIYYWDKERE